eukprot:CAMPEP_0119522818 /NCGR_PEP_ID=MMETSP1344-20130328/38004_1 /TAXON_ID=236787 /ORGANISM="Florenciella parvula, Strain CCMP2471" /LENGTH=214 /DNA_ID=CAMNT_0007560877 /DNA_START=38 /DNA_END=683 /DNA_ORIENTATION=-
MAALRSCARALLVRTDLSNSAIFGGVALRGRPFAALELLAIALMRFPTLFLALSVTISHAPTARAFLEFFGQRFLRATDGAHSKLDVLKLLSSSSVRVPAAIFALSTERASLSAFATSCSVHWSKLMPSGVAPDALDFSYTCSKCLMTGMSHWSRLASSRLEMDLLPPSGAQPSSFIQFIGASPSRITASSHGNHAFDASDASCPLSDAVAEFK